VFKALKVSVAILNLIRASMGSQWSLFIVNELETVKPVPVTHYHISLLQIFISY